MPSAATTRRQQKQAAEQEKQRLEASRAPLVAHLVEFRKRFVTMVIAYALAFVLCYLFAEQIYAFLVQPLADALPDGTSRKLIYTNLIEVFFTYLRIALWSAFFVAFPVIAWQIYAYTAPGLYRRERKAMLPFLILSPILFAGGAALAYYLVFPLAWPFFLSFETPELTQNLGIELQAKVDEYLSLVMQMLMAFGLSFQLPILLSLLARAGIVKARTLARGRRYALVAIVGVAAILTPPDIISQITLSIPLYLLYELSIVTARIMERKATRIEDDELEDADVEEAEAAEAAEAEANRHA